MSFKRRNLELKANYDNILTQPRRGLEINSVTFHALSGSVNEPAYSFIDSKNTGLFLSGTDDSPYVSLVCSGNYGLTINPNGLAGIGTDNPLELLHIVKNQNAESTSLLIENLDQRVKIGSYYEAGVIQYGSISSQQDSGTETNLTIQPGGGNVGIGTNNPGSLLHLYGSAPEIRLTDTTASSDEFVFGNSNGKFFIYNTTDTRDDFYIDGDGKVGIGTNTPTNALEINNASSATINIHSTTSGGIASVEIGSGSLGNRYAYIDLVGDDTYTDFGCRIIRKNVGANSDSNIEHHGTGSLNLYNYEAGDIAFYTSATKRMTIKSGGDVGIGITVPGFRLDVQDNVIGYMTRFINDGDSAGNAGIIIRCGKDDGTGGTVYLLGQDGDGDAVGYIENSSGGVFGIIDVSDEAVKRDIAPTKIKGLDVIKNIDPIEYRYTKHGPEGRLNKCGFSAQNLQQAFPEAVSAHPDTNLLGVSRSALIPVLVKAVREQQDQIDELKQIIENLKPTESGVERK